MIVVVTYRYATNPQDASVGADGAADWSRAKSAVSEYDPVAIQLGRNLVDTKGIELVSVTASKSDVAGPMVRKNAVSKGLDRGVVVASDAIAGWNAMKITSALTELVKSIEGADTLLADDSSTDESTKIVLAPVAGFLGWSASRGISVVAETADGYKTTQGVPGGGRMIAVSGPVVVSASSDAVAPKVPSIKGALAAGKKPVEKVEVPPIGVEVAVVGRLEPERRAHKNKIFESADASAQLVAAPRADDVF